MTDARRRGRVVIVGASLAGCHAAHTLRKNGFAGEITLVGSEAQAPYDRPPLSKGYLHSSKQVSEIGLRFVRQVQATFLLGARAVSLDAENRTVEVDGGQRLSFDGAVIATGSSPIRLDPSSFTGVRYLRTVEDAQDLRSRLRTADGPLVILGAGLIGCEVAAVARGLGLGVVLIDPLLPCQRSVGPAVGEFLRRLHAARGVDVRTGPTALGVEPAGRQWAVQTDAGDRIDAGTVLAAIGARPETAWLAGSGLAVDDGVLCDEGCVAAPGIVAAGDVARWQHPSGPGGYLRLEHWSNAVEQGRHAARSLLASMAGADPEPYRPLPWFWSDQYGHKLQVAGQVPAGCAVQVMDGDLGEMRFFAEFRSAGETVGAVGFDAAAPFNAWLTSAARREAGPRPSVTGAS